MKIENKSFTQQKYGSFHPLRRFLIKRFLKRVLMEIKSKKPVNILDIGCGEGQADKYFLENLPEIKITGVDVDEKALSKAKINCPRMKVKKASIYNLPFKDFSFDLVISLEVLEHLAEPRRALKEIKRIGRKFIVSVPYEPYFSLLSFLSGKYLKNFGRHPEHIQAWDKITFAKFVKKEFPKAKIKTCFPWLIAGGER